MLRKSYPLYLANRPVAAGQSMPVTNKHSGDPVSRVTQASSEVIEQAISAADGAKTSMRKLPAHKRAAVLSHLATRLQERSEELAQVLAIEAGKPIRDARGEIARGVDTFRLSAEEATRIHGEYMPLDISARAEGYEGICKRVPIGPCAFITPFNFPINLAAHKIGPAIAAGCPFVLKPASSTPVSALLLGEMLAETDLPAGAFSILPCRGKDAEVLATDERFKLLSFTGSGDVGWWLKSIAGKKQVILELGGNAACIVDRDIDEEYAASRMMIGAFYQSGQSCISVQRVMVHASIYERFKGRLVDEARKLKFGDPLDEATFLGPLISEDDAKRVESWVGNAIQRGANLLCGGKRHGRFYEATFVENVPDDAELSCSEVFGPVATIEPFTDFADACKRANAGRYGLQAGVFTRNLNSAFYAFNELEVGGVIINDIPSFRVDSMPYGGVKDSGLGREGVRFAIEHLTERRLMVLNRVGRSAT